MVRWAPTVGAIAGGVSCVLLAGSLTALGGVLLGIPSTPTAYVGTGVLVGSATHPAERQTVECAACDAGWASGCRRSPVNGAPPWVGEAPSRAWRA